MPSHLKAVFQAIFVTFLWSTSWVLIKIGLQGSLPALTFAGLRYTLAFVFLAPFVLFNPTHRTALRQLTRGEWGQLAALGVVFYTLTQGAQFLSLAYLPAAMVSLLLNITSVGVAFAGIVLLNERPASGQWGGILLALVGIGVYFLPFAMPQAQIAGVLIALACVFTNTASSILGRFVNQRAHLSPLVVTFTSMGIGALLLLFSGLIFQGIGRLSWQEWGIVLWLAVVNTALAFTLWNRSLKTLSAVESSILNSLMLPQIAILAVVFLGERLSPKEIAGLVLVGLGTLLVQLKRQSGSHAARR